MIFIYSLYQEGREVTFETGTHFFTSNGAKPVHTTGKLPLRSLTTDTQFPVKSTASIYCFAQGWYNDLQHTAFNKKLPEESFLCWSHIQVNII